MLFRIWQHALMDQPMPTHELWHWVHVCYGEELGLTSDDEDYVPPVSLVDSLTSRYSPDLFPEESGQSLQKTVEVKEMPGELLQNGPPGDRSPADFSDSSETDEDKSQDLAGNTERAEPTFCPVKHEGKMLLKEVVPLSVNDLFTLLFTYNDFNKNLMESMKYTDITVPNWEENSETGLKMRIINLTVPVHQPVGPKTCRVTETQIMQACSRSGELYVIEVEAVNAGVPYCDSFYIATHYCITRTSATEATFTVHCQIKYRKSVWGFVKGFIEKNVWLGLEEFFQSLRKALVEQCIKKETKSIGEEVEIQKSEDNKQTGAAPSIEPQFVGVTPSIPVFSPPENLTALWVILGVLAILLLFNTVLYYKLTVLESYDREARLSSVIDSEILSEERTHEQWMALLRSQAIQHHKEIQQWKTTLKSIVSLLKQAEDLIASLHSNIQSAVNERVLETLRPLSNLDGVVDRNKHTEL